MKYNTGKPFTYGAIDPEEHPYGSSKIAVLPVPYEATTSFGKGTANGPREIIQASRYLELYDEETRGDVSRLGIFTLPEVDSVFSSPAKMVEEIYRAALSIIDDEKFLVSLGGEHTITPPLVKAHLDKHHDLCVLQIDAHADLWDSFEGSEYSHACAMRRVLELARGVQVAIRSICEEEVEAIPSLPTRVIYAHEVRSDPYWQNEVLDALSDPVYITVDLDGLDPSIMPSVGTPEPGGLDWYQVCGLLKEVASRYRVVGFDINELAPIPGLSAPNFLAAKLAYKMLSYAFLQ